MDMVIITKRMKWKTICLRIHVQCSYTVYMHMYVNRNYECIFYFLDLDITTFMAQYRFFFPNASVLPKMHFLEDHLIDWVIKYKTGFGLLGEQGVKSIHHEFNDLKRTYSCIQNKEELTLCLMKEHHRRCHPENVNKIPHVKHKTITEE